MDSDELATATTQLRVAIARIYRTLRATAAPTLTPSQSSVLHRVEEFEPVRMGELAQREGITAASLSKVVDSLEEAALVRREADRDDKRVTLITLTALGRTRTEGHRDVSTRALLAALTELDATERASLLAAVPALVALADHLLSEVDGRDAV
jgi:DNA-binding MarR family transcriptional regulator